MGRQVVTEKDLQKLRLAGAGGVAGGAVEVPPVDTYNDRLIKYIPAEVIAVFLTLAGLIKSAASVDQLKFLFWGIFVFLLLMTPFYVWRVLKITKREQIIIATASFAVWVFAGGGPFEYFP